MLVVKEIEHVRTDRWHAVPGGFVRGAAATPLLPNGFGWGGHGLGHDGRRGWGRDERGWGGDSSGALARSGTARVGAAQGYRRDARHGAPRHLLRALFAQLDTTPGQEKAIANSVYEAGERMRELRSLLRTTRREVAALIGSDVLDVVALEALLAQHQTTFDRVRGELVKTASTIHETLDTQQRRALGELLADGSVGTVFRRDLY